MIYGEILIIIHFYHFDSDPRFPPFYYMLGRNLGSLLYGDVSMMYRKLEFTGLGVYTQQKSSAQVGVQVNSVLTRNGCIKCYISLFKENILQQLDAFQTEIPGSLMKLCVFKASRGHP